MWSKNWEDEPLPAICSGKTEYGNVAQSPVGNGNRNPTQPPVEDGNRNVNPTQPPVKKQKLIYMNTSKSGASSDSSRQGSYNNNDVVNRKSSDPYKFLDLQSPSSSSSILLSRANMKRNSFHLIHEKSLGEATQRENGFPTVEEIWSKFINLFHLGKSQNKFIVHYHYGNKKNFPNPLKDVLSSNVYLATDDDVYDFLFYVDLTEKLDNSYFQAIISSINNYRQGRNELVPIEVFQHLKEASPRFQGPWMNVRDQVKALPILLNTPEQPREYFKEFKDFCYDPSRTASDPFQASPKTVSEFIEMLFKTMTENYSPLLKSYSSFYQENVRSILNNLSYFMEFPHTHDDWMENDLIKAVVEAAKACDDKLHGNELANSLLPSYNYTKTRVENNLSEEGYWRSRFSKKVLHDLHKEKLLLQVAARDLGVTPEMLFNAMCEFYLVFDAKKIKLPSLTEFVENDLGSKSQYWKDIKMRGLLNEVRHRRIPIETLAFKIGVSRNEVDLKCGGVKSLKEIEAEEELERIKRIKEQEEVAENRIKTTHLDRQIMYAENHEEDLCEYERQRLANLRERKALMEMLDITGDKLEIRKLNKIIQRPGSKEGKEAGVEEDTPKREKSSRILKQQERKRLKSSEEALNKSHQCQGSATDLTPKWFGRRFATSNYKKEISELNRANVLPKLEISAGELLEITDDYRRTKILLESISEECKEEMEEEDNYKTDVNWQELTVVKEHLVSTSSVTCIDSYSDLVSYGTENGAVGVLIASHSLNFRPHTDMVSGLVMDGAKILSSSFDGTVRGLDLAKGRVSLEYNWDFYGDCKHGVVGMARRSDHSYILDCDKKLVMFDLRQKDAASLVDVEGVKCSYPYSDLRPSTINVEPRNSNLFSICRDSSVTIWDVRNMEKTVWKLNSNNLSFAGWSSNGGEFGVFRTDKYWIFDVQGGTPNKERRVQFEPQVPREWKTGLGSDKFSLCGSLWCPWQSSLLFYVGKSQKRLSSKHCISKTSLSAINTAR